MGALPGLGRARRAIMRRNETSHAQSSAEKVAEYRVLAKQRGYGFCQCASSCPRVPGSPPHAQWCPVPVVAKRNRRHAPKSTQNATFLEAQQLSPGGLGEITWYVVVCGGMCETNGDV